MSVTYAISGRGAKGGLAKAVLIFTVSIKVDDVVPNSTKADLEVVIEGPEEGQPKLNIMGGERGTFHVGFTPALPGQYWVDFIFKGVLANEPFQLPIKDMFNKIPNISYTGKLVNRSGPALSSSSSSSAIPSRPSSSDASDRRLREEEERRKREEEERRRREDEERRRREEERRIKEEEERRIREEERRIKEEEEMRIKEEEERIMREELERQREEEEEEERLRQQEEEEERLRQQQEEERKRRESMIKRKEEAERKAREEAERKAQEEAERKMREEEEAERRERESEVSQKKKADDERKLAIEKKKAEVAAKRKEEEQRRKDEERKKDEEQRKREEEERRMEEDQRRKEEEEQRRLLEEQQKKKQEEERAKTAAAAAAPPKSPQAPKKEPAPAAASTPSPTTKTPPPTKAVVATPPKTTASTGDYAGHIVSMNFVLRALTKSGDPKTVGGDKDNIRVEANGQKITLIEDAGDGSYSFDYKSIYGDNLVSVAVRSQTVQGFPITFRRKTIAEIEEEIFQKEMFQEEEKRREEELQRQMELELRKQEEEEEELMRKEEEERMRKEEESMRKEEEERMRKEEEERQRREENERMRRDVEQTIANNGDEGLSEAEIKIREIEERKRKIAEKRAEIARKRETAEALVAATSLSTSGVAAAAAAAASAAASQDAAFSPPTSPHRPVENVRAKMWEQKLQNSDSTEEKQPKKIEINTDRPASKLSSIWEQRLQGVTVDEDQEKEKERRDRPSKTSSNQTPSKGTAAARWLQSAQEEEKKEEAKTKVDIPVGSGATKVASLWKDRLTGTLPEEKKVEKTTVDLGGKGASKFASVWQSRLEGKEPDPVEIKKTTIDIPVGSGASKVASLWQSKLEEKAPEPKIEKGSVPRKTGPSALAQQWEKNATSSESSSTTSTKKDIEELKMLMAREREQLMGGLGHSGGGSGGTDTFTPDPEELAILFHFLSTHLKGETIPQKLPFSADNPKVFSDLSDGIALCKFFNKMIPDMLDVRVITTRVNDRRDKVDNWNLCVQSGKAAGCRLSDIKPEALADGDAESIQKVIFHITKVGLETDIKMCDDYLTEWMPGFDVDTIAVMNIDEILLKWANGVVSSGGHSRVAKNLTKDFCDSFIYMVIFNEVLGLNLDLNLNELERAETVLMSCEELNRGPLITLQGILDGIYWQNYMLLSSLLLTAAEIHK